jgi:predicted O-methyltransferase YrrM
MLEIGVFEGRSSLWFLQNILTSPESLHVAVDTFKGGEDQLKNGVDCTNLLEKYIENVKEYSPRERTIKGNSSEVLKQWIKWKWKFDVVYVDGSHVADDVSKDLRNSWELLKVGGIMMMDDYLWTVDPIVEQRPKYAIDAWLETYQGQYALLHKGEIVLVEKII